MALDPPPQPPPQAGVRGSPRTGARGPNAERSAAMRGRIIDATIDCLNDSGFAATTTQHVVERGGVSRGAMLHHFPTRVELMIAVARHCAQAQTRLVTRRMAGIADPITQFVALTEATWEAVRSRTGVAFIEIMLGGRNEKGLDTALAGVINEVEDRQRRDVWNMGERIGMKDLQREVETMSRLHTAAMRGLVLEMLCSPRADGVDACVALLGDYKRYITGRLLVGDPVSPRACPMETGERPEGEDPELPATDAAGR